MLYLWLKALHIIAVVCWFSVLFYLPRLFVYHAECDDTISQNRFVIMERRLYFGIGWPSALATTLFGLWLLHLNPMLAHQKWMQIKLALIVFLWAYHIILGLYRKAFQQGRSQKSGVFFRVINEVPTLLLIAIVLLAVLKQPI
jgi:protoporphyrinogen IX oxidase